MQEITLPQRGDRIIDGSQGYVVTEVRNNLPNEVFNVVDGRGNPVGPFVSLTVTAESIKVIRKRHQDAAELLNIKYEAGE